MHVHEEPKKRLSFCQSVIDTGLDVIKAVGVSGQPYVVAENAQQGRENYRDTRVWRETKQNNSGRRACGRWFKLLEHRNKPVQTLSSETTGGGLPRDHKSTRSLPACQNEADDRQ